MELVDVEAAEERGRRLSTRGRADAQLHLTCAALDDQHEHVRSGKTADPHPQ